MYIHSQRAQSYNKNIPVRCIPPICTDHTCFNGHQMSALVGVLEVNKFEQVSSDGYQMSIARGLGGPPCLEGGLYSEVECNNNMGNGHMRPLMGKLADRHD